VERLGHPMPQPDSGAQRQQGAAACPKRAIGVFFFSWRCDVQSRMNGVPSVLPYGGILGAFTFMGSAILLSFCYFYFLFFSYFSFLT
jgi:hypothetical protein